jgi:hypothetical protein
VVAKEGKAEVGKTEGLLQIAALLEKCSLAEERVRVVRGLPPCASY